VRLLKRRQAINRSADSDGVALCERNKLSHGSIVLGDDELLAFLNSPQKLRKMRSCIECTDY